MDAESEWDSAFQAAAECGALTEADIDGLSDALAALEAGPERDELMRAQVQSLASGRLGSMLASGQRVEISGLVSRPELTGTFAKVLCFDSKRGRYGVILEEKSESMFLKRSNLRIIVDARAAQFVDAVQGGLGYMCEAADVSGDGPAVHALNQAYKALQERSVEAAVAAGTQAVALDGADPRTHLALADAYNMAGDLSRAVSAYSSAMAKAQAGSLHWAKAAVHMYECINDPECPKRVKEARPVWMADPPQLLGTAELVVAADPKQGVSWRMRSDAFRGLGDLAQAAASLERAIELCPDAAGKEGMRAEVRRLDAEATLRKEHADVPNAAAGVPGSAAAGALSIEEVAAQAASSGLPAGALAKAAAHEILLEMARRSSGKVAPVVAPLDNPSAVIGHACKRVDAIKDEGNAHLKAAWLEGALCSYQVALQILQDCKGLTDLEHEAGGAKQQIAKRECVLHANRSVVLGKLGRLEEALREAFTSVKVQPAYAKGHHRVGSALQALGREEAAQRSFRKSEELQREQARADAAAGSGAAEDDLRFTDLTDGVDPLSWVWGARLVRAGTGEEASVSELYATNGGLGRDEVEILVRQCDAKLEAKAKALVARGKHVHAAACRLRVAAALFESYRLAERTLPRRQWERSGRKNAWLGLVGRARAICEDVADMPFEGQKYGRCAQLALRAWRLALPFDGDGSAPADDDGPHDYGKMHCNAGLAARDLRRYEEARRYFAEAAVRAHPDAMLEGAILKWRGLGGPKDREGALRDIAEARRAARKFDHGGGEVQEFPHPYRMQQGQTLEQAAAAGVEAFFPEP